MKNFLLELTSVKRIDQLRQKKKNHKSRIVEENRNSFAYKNEDLCDSKCRGQDSFLGALFSCRIFFFLKFSRRPTGKQ